MHIIVSNNDGVWNSEGLKIVINVIPEWERASNARGKFGYDLGLAIVKKYVELLNCSLEYKENKPGGSIFILSIPIDFRNKTDKNL